MPGTLASLTAVLDPVGTLLSIIGLTAPVRDSSPWPGTAGRRSWY